MKPTIAIHKFTGCAGCQLELLRLEDMFLSLLDLVEISYWVMVKRENDDGPWDISFVEGSISTPEEIEEIKEIRKKSKILVAYGDCAIGGCIPSIRNWIPQLEAKRRVYPNPSSIHSIKVMGIGEYVKVDFELKGCPPHRENFLELLKSLFLNIRPRLPKYPVCMECKFKENECLLKKNLPCMGPVTSAGCGALCPSLNRICEGCYGPMSNPNVNSLSQIFEDIGLTKEEIEKKFKKYASTEFQEFK